MSPVLVALCYGSATLFSLYLLWHFGVKPWWSHALSVAIAFSLGFARLPAFFDTPNMTLAVGWVFIFLLLWGIAAPFFSLARNPNRWMRRHQ
jgi:hypothetical protein